MAAALRKNFSAEVLSVNNLFLYTDFFRLGHDNSKFLTFSQFDDFHVSNHEYEKFASFSVSVLHSLTFRHW